jgi:hypothetical protein
VAVMAVADVGVLVVVAVIKWCCKVGVIGYRCFFQDAVQLLICYTQFEVFAIVSIHIIV